jgi:hypothetical protein
VAKAFQPNRFTLRESSLKDIIHSTGAPFGFGGGNSPYFSLYKDNLFAFKKFLADMNQAAESVPQSVSEL